MFLVFRWIWGPVSSFPLCDDGKVRPARPAPTIGFDPIDDKMRLRPELNEKPFIFSCLCIVESADFWSFSTKGQRFYGIVVLLRRSLAVITSALAVHWNKLPKLLLIFPPSCVTLGIAHLGMSLSSHVTKNIVLPVQSVRLVNPSQSDLNQVSAK